MGKIKSGLVAAMLLASASGSAWATEVGKFYGAIDLGKTKVKDWCVGTAGLNCTDTDTLFRGAVGYQVNPNVAVEASYADYGTVEVSDNFGALAEGSASGFQFSIVGSVPVSDVFSLTGKLGLALTDAEVTNNFGLPNTKDSNTTMAWGLGVRFQLNESVALRAQYESLGEISADSADPTADDDINLMTAGVIFNF